MRWASPGGRGTGAVLRFAERRLERAPFGAFTGRRDDLGGREARQDLRAPGGTGIAGSGCPADSRARGVNARRRGEPGRDGLSVTANAHVLVVEDEPNVARMLVESRSYRDPMSLDAVGAEFVRRVGVVVRPGPGRGLWLRTYW